MSAAMQTVSTPDRPTGAVRYVLRRVDLARYGITSRHLRWFPDYRDEQMHAQLQRDIAAINRLSLTAPLRAGQALKVLTRGK